MMTVVIREMGRCLAVQVTRTGRTTSRCYSGSPHMQQPPKSVINLQDTFTELEKLSKQSHAGLVLWSSSFLEQIVEYILRLHMPKLSKSLGDKLFTGYGPLSSFSAKIEIAYALDLITDENRHQLNAIRGIRNVFAHSSDPDLHLDHELVSRLIAKLTRAAKIHRPNSSIFLDVVVECARSLGDIHTRAIQKRYPVSGLMAAFLGDLPNNAHPSKKGD